MGDKKSVVVFDLDGTLADTSGDLIAAANVCFRAMGVGDMLDPASDAPTALRGGRAMLALGLKRLGREGDEAEIDRQYPVLLEAYGKAIDRFTTFYPNAMEVVRDLKARGYGVAICTNKPEALADLLMEKLGVLHEFDALVGADTLPVRKPNPEPYFEAVRRSAGGDVPGLLVGDSDTDFKTSRAAGVPSVLVNFGPAADEIKHLEPDATIESFLELPGVVERLLQVRID